MAVSPQRVAELRADLAMLKANRGRLREQLRSGAVLRREEENARRFTEARRIRDAILAAPGRYYAELAAELDVEPWRMLQVLTDAVRQLLAAVAGSGPFVAEPFPGIYEPQPAELPGEAEVSAESGKPPAESRPAPVRDAKGRFVRSSQTSQTPNQSAQRESDH